jgi:hypothetical protein
MQVWSGRKLPTDVDEDPRPGRNGFGCAPGALSASGSRTFDHTYGRALVAGRQPRRVRCSRRLLTAGQRPDWSPDGTTIVYDHFNAWGLPPTSAIWAVNADGTGARLARGGCGTTELLAWRRADRVSARVRHLVDERG